MKKLLVFLLIISLSAGMCACKPRTGASSAPEMQKGARENVVVSENPKTEENTIASKSEPDEVQEHKDDSEDAKAAAEKFLEAAQTGSKEKIQPFADYNKLLRITQEQNAEWQFKQILSHMTCQVVSAQIDDDGVATVGAKISNVDMGVILPLWFKEAMQLEYDNALSASPLDRDGLDSKLKVLFAQMLDERANGKVETLVDIRLEKVAGEWKPKPNDELGDALLGRYFSAYASVTGNMMQSGGQPAEELIDYDFGISETEQGTEYSEE